jgi:hypothetical protein
VLQVPIEQVPDPRLRERMRAREDREEIHRSTAQELEGWLAARGLRVVLHRKVPVRKRRWIGIVPMAGWFTSHSLVMRWGEVLFDPTKDWRFAALMKLTPGAELATLRRIYGAWVGPRTRRVRDQLSEG